MEAGSGEWEGLEVEEGGLEVGEVDLGEEGLAEGAECICEL